MAEIIYKEESYEIISVCFKVYNKLGKGLVEAVYKDALELEFRKRNIPFEREKSFDIYFEETKLNRKYPADFVVYDKIILEVKATKDIIGKYIKQTLNYLSASKFRLGIIANFGCDSLIYKRLIN